MECKKYKYVDMKKLSEEEKENIIKSFKKTHIYIKTHTETGIKYFGKSIKKSQKKVHQYKGSGPDWKNILKKYGKSYTTEIVATFDNPMLCNEYCINFSKENNIVKSKEWANKMYEDGIGRGCLYTLNMNEKERIEHGKKSSIGLSNRSKEDKEKHRKNISKARKKLISNMTEEEKKSIIERMNNISSEEKNKKYKKVSKKLKEYHLNMTDEQKKKRAKKISENRKGVKCKIIKCPKCGKEGESSNMVRYHGVNGEKCSPNVHDMRKLLHKKGIKYRKLNKKQCLDIAKENNFKFIMKNKVWDII